MRNQQLNFRGGSVLIIVNSSRRQEQACIFPSTHVTIHDNDPSAVIDQSCQAADLLRITLCLEGASVTMKPILFCFSLAAVAWGVSAVIADQGIEKPTSNPRKNAPAKPVEAKSKRPAPDKKPVGETVVFGDPLARNGVQKAVIGRGRLMSFGRRQRPDRPPRWSLAEHGGRCDEPGDGNHDEKDD